ncbi:family 10 glycosylhydrolase [Roseofilum sp. BLCC_M91]|uniref:Family 10 glycosylhydrolase n=1 Tax=Roseofilum halophilum BLCC-M91 TaxID=3022259 RepID=A0ABT7BGH4_9CYAN|nr:family 10 glycosylhydrolase [Roseofilum halophilum]MDJ1178271.1 family 10 glycosylhydrolase [Roseofilum halophilum BLCC-M91]
MTLSFLRLHKFNLWLVLFLLVSPILGTLTQVKPSFAAVNAYCQLSNQERQDKEQLRQAALSGNPEAQQRYQALVQQHTAQLQNCRARTWPQTQAIWLRLYPCDLFNGNLDRVMDEIVNKGYNEVYVEAFFNGQVLLPANDNPTPWPSVVRLQGQENADLLALAIEKARERGLRVYAWLFSMNFGYNYSLLGDRQQALARNGNNETSLSVHDQKDTGYEVTGGDTQNVFIDPYHPQAKRDYYYLVNSILKRQPDGMLFDYIRYPRLTGPASVATKVQDLWIYGPASQQSLYQRATNNKGRELIQAYISKGYITIDDIQAANRRYPQEGQPMWQGRNTPQASLSLRQQQNRLQQELWFLTVAHALQGVIDFLTLASAPAQRQGLPTGAVFFPDANRVVGRGYDSRLQPWDRFPASMEWHPMSYGVCGGTECITEQVERVLSMAAQGAQVKPVLAGQWGRAYRNRPSLEAQMRDLQRWQGRISAISHFAFSWQEPQIDGQRRSCRPQ